MRTRILAIAAVALMLAGAGVAVWPGGGSAQDTTEARLGALETRVAALETEVAGTGSTAVANSPVATPSEIINSLPGVLAGNGKVTSNPFEMPSGQYVFEVDVTGTGSATLELVALNGNESFALVTAVNAPRSEAIMITIDHDAGFKLVSTGDNSATWLIKVSKN